MQAHCYNNQAQQVIRTQAQLDRPRGSFIFCTKKHIIMLGMMGFGMLLQMLPAPAVLAAEYELAPFISSSANYNDNVSFGLEGEEVSGHILTTGVNLSYDDQISVLRLETQADFDRFNATRFDTDDQSAALSYRRQFEKGSVSAQAQTMHTSARTLEDQDTDVGSRETAATRADANSLTLSGFYRLNEKNTLQGSLSGSLRDYQSNNLQGYAYYSANGLWQHTLSSRLQLQTRASYARYTPDESLGLDFTDQLLDLAASENVTGNDLDGRLQSCLDAVGFIPISLITVGIPNNNLGNPRAPCFDIETYQTEQNTVSLQLGFVYVINEMFSLDMLAGRSETGSERDSISVAQRGKYINRGKDNTNSYDATLTYSGERLTSAFKASQGEQATSDGTLRLTTRVDWNTNWQLSYLSSLKFDLGWFERRYDSNIEVAQRANETNMLARIGFHQRFTETWQGNIDYVYRVRSFNYESSNPQRNAITMTIRWSPTPTFWSR